MESQGFNNNDDKLDVAWNVSKEVSDLFVIFKKQHINYLFIF